MTSLAIFLAFGFVGQFLQDTEMGAARTWLREYETQVHDRFLSLAGYPLLVARAYEDLHWEYHEQWLCVDLERNGELIAEVRRPVHLSIMDQLAWGHIADPARSFEELVETVELDRIIVRGPQCADIRRVVEDFPPIDVEFELDLETWIRLHPRFLEVKAHGRSGSAHLQETEEESAVGRWFADSLRTLVECAEAQGRGFTVRTKGTLARPYACGAVDAN